MFEFLLLDLDDTILDFHKAEGIAIRKTFAHFGVDPTDAVVARYSVINKEHWARLDHRGGHLGLGKEAPGRYIE